MPSWRLFYGGMKGGVELSFLDLFELFSILTGALNAGIESLERLRLDVLFENTNESEVSKCHKEENHFAAAREIAADATSLKIVTRLGATKLLQ
jgi:hypothetical protein